MTLVIEREQKQVRRLERIDPGPRIRPVRDEVAQPRAHPRQDRRFQQELTRVRVQSRQDLALEELDDIAVHAREALRDRSRPVFSLHAQRSQLQARNPTLRPFVEACGERRLDLDSRRVAEELLGLAIGKPQLPRADLGKLAQQSQAAERQPRRGHAGRQNP